MNMMFKQTLKCAVLLCAIGTFNLRAGEPAAVPAALHIADAMQQAVPGSPGLEINADAFVAIGNSLGLPVAAKEFSEGCGKLASAMPNGKIQISLVSASDAATVIGALLLTKSLYEGLWGEDTEKEKAARLNALKEASSNIAQAIEEKKKTLSEYASEYRNWIGGILGILLLCNKKILNL